MSTINNGTHCRSVTGAPVNSASADLTRRRATDYPISCDGMSSRHTRFLSLLTSQLELFLVRMRPSVRAPVPDGVVRVLVLSWSNWGRDRVRPDPGRTISRQGNYVTFPGDASWPKSTSRTSGFDWQQATCVVDQSWRHRQQHPHPTGCMQSSHHSLNQLTVD